MLQKSQKEKIRFTLVFVVLVERHRKDQLSLCMIEGHPLFFFFKIKGASENGEQDLLFDFERREVNCILVFFLCFCVSLLFRVCFIRKLTKERKLIKP